MAVLTARLCRLTYKVKTSQENNLWEEAVDRLQKTSIGWQSHHRRP
jgi:hypothetical protein